MTEAHVGYECEHDRDDPMAREMVNICSTTYPGHDWFVLIKGGVVQIKLMDINPQWGMVLHYSQIKDDAAARKKDVIRAAGEFLERAGLIRGYKRANQVVTHVEGMPDKHLRVTH